MLEGLEGRPRSSRIEDSGFFSAGRPGPERQEGGVGLLRRARRLLLAAGASLTLQCPTCTTLGKLGFLTSQFLYVQNQEDSDSLPGAAGTE